MRSVKVVLVRLCLVEHDYLAACGDVKALGFADILLVLPDRVLGGELSFAGNFGFWHAGSVFL
ncbi:TPA: hypothetical protein HA225_06060 [Candidatus Micrarchaeota archaeon]|nr:hypothetical protein [Candidatus Micrarchaeota archaeon]